MIATRTTSRHPVKYYQEMENEFSMKARNSKIWRGAKGNFVESDSIITTKSKELDNTARTTPLPLPQPIEEPRYIGEITITYHCRKSSFLEFLKLKHTRSLLNQ
jgi:hypothetical protein